jgi:glucose-induced degradation protein 8
MDYLINEGYPSAARKFAMEANLKPAEDFASIQERVEIRNAIHAGDIQTAIEKINELDPEVGQLLLICPFSFAMIIRVFMHHS